MPKYFLKRLAGRNTARSKSSLTALHSYSRAIQFGSCAPPVKWAQKVRKPRKSWSLLLASINRKASVGSGCAVSFSSASAADLRTSGLELFSRSATRCATLAAAGPMLPSGLGGGHAKAFIRIREQIGTCGAASAHAGSTQKRCPTSRSPTSLRWAVNTSASAAATSGRPKRSNKGFGPSKAWGCAEQG
jgi:hypothetical protein